MYDHLHPEPSWPLNFRSSTIYIIWAINDIASANFRTFGWQFTVCWFVCSFWINTARLPRLSWSSSCPQFPWHTISNFQNLNHVHQVCVESYAVGHMVECTMTVIIQTDSYQALTAPSIIHMTSLTWILLVNFVTNLVCAFSLNRNHKGALEFIGHHAAKFGH
jgi:hypothetical protein